jgi:hypothetical protein
MTREGNIVHMRIKGSAALFAVVAVLAAGCMRPGGPGTPTTRPPTGGPIGVQHKRVVYPAVNVPGGSNGDMGMKNAGVPIGAEKPCSACYLTSFHASLIDASGRDVNVREGYWLHHMVLANTRPSTPGLACGVEGFFTSGNERITIDLQKSGNYGYPVRAADSWSLIEELANVTTTAKSMRVAVDFDYVPMGTPGIKPAKPVWLGAMGCSGAYIPAQQGKHSYSWTWNATTAGKVIYAHMHMHDGATNGTFAVNGQQYCDSTQMYGTTPESIEGPGTMMQGMAHISEVVGCQGTTANPIATFRRGDRLTQTANYDSNAHMLMGTEPLMGIGHAWIDMS